MRRPQYAKKYTATPTRKISHASERMNSQSAREVPIPSGTYPPKLTGILQFGKKWQSGHYFGRYPQAGIDRFPTLVAKFENRSGLF
jgi:hypothetical protein